MSSPPPPDLVAGIRRRDPHVLSWVYATYSPRLSHYLLQRLGAATPTLPATRTTMALSASSNAPPMVKTAACRLPPSASASLATSLSMCGGAVAAPSRSVRRS